MSPTHSREARQQTEREQFEAWAVRQKLSVMRISNRENALYDEYETALAWSSWQARAALANNAP